MSLMIDRLGLLRLYLEVIGGSGGAARGPRS